MRRAMFIVAAVLMCTANAVEAIPIYAGYPPPGPSPTVTFINDGNVIGNTGGSTKTYDFTGMNTSGWSALFFGYDSVRAPLNTTVFPSTTQELLWNGVNNSIELVSTGAPWTRNAGFTYSTPVRFRNSFYDMFGNNITGTVAAMALAPPPDGVQAQYVLPITDALLSAWGGGFKSFVAIEGQNEFGVWVGVNNISTTCGGCTQSGVTGAFWYEPEATVTAVPEPASMMLVGTGLLGLVKTARSRRRDRKSV